MNDGVKAYSPDDLSEEEVEACLSLIENGGAVDPESAKSQLPRAMVLVVARVGNQIVGVGAIKGLRRQYGAKISTRSGFKLDIEALEVGYVSVDEGHRGQGICGQIVETLLAASSGGPLFATTSNERMRQTLRRLGFRRQGNAWAGTSGELSLWIRPAQPDHE